MELIDVKNWGASGNGVDDDTATVQRALTYAATVGYTVYFPAGIYRISSPLHTGACRNIIGDGHSSILKSTSNNIRILNIDGSDTLVKDLKFIGDLTTTGQVGIWVDSVYRTKITNCYFQDLSMQGIYINNSSSSQYGLDEACLINNCIFYGCGNTGNRSQAGGSGVYIDSNADYTMITGCLFTHQNLWAITCWAGNFLISDCQMVKNQNCVCFGDAGNGGHGTISCCTMNHTFHADNHDIGLAFYVVGGTHFFGINVVGCHMFHGDMDIENASGVTFLGCTFGIGNFTFVANVVTIFNTCRFYPAYGNNINKSANSLVQGINNYIIYPQDSSQNGQPYTVFPSTI